MPKLVVFTTWQDANNVSVDNELGFYDGTTTTVLDLFPGSTGGIPNKSQPTAFVQLGNKLFFTAVSAADGNELWSWDGVAAPTEFKNINPGAAGAFDRPLDAFPTGPSFGKLPVVINNVMYFPANDGAGSELWRT